MKISHRLLPSSLLLLMLAVKAISAQLSANEPSILKAADRDVENDEDQKNFRSIFNTSPGPDKFFSSDDAADEASDDVKKTNTVVVNAKKPADRLFNANGQSNNAEVAQVNADFIQSRRCIYDSANSQSCSSLYREPTGRCTNTMNGQKTWGMAGTPYTRLLTPQYQDGVGKRRVTELHSGNALKSPRLISTTVTTNDIVLNFKDGVSAHTMQWGQFIAHEFTQLAESAPNAACCPDQIANSTYGRKATKAELNNIRALLIKFRGDICQQIELENDPEYGEDVCMSHTRSRATPQHSCALGPRQQMNAITHVFDASNVYGSSKAEQDRLRDSTGGKMKTQIVKGVSLPPPDTRGCPLAKQQANKCPFLGGDSRINTTPNLISAHTAFVNKHNQIAAGLAAENPHWDNEKLFQESRRIISAIQSNIHYYEYLPIIIGKTILTKYKLQSYDGYDGNVNPSILNELAGAAMRFGHSTIDGFFTLESDGGKSDFVDLKTNFFNSDKIYSEGTRQCVRGLSEDVPWKVDRNFPTQMRDFLFNQKLDIISLNINRGRDHGFSSYVDYRAHYHLSIPKSFADLSSTHSAVVIAELQKVYTSVKDVELYIGGVTELPVDGGLVGELFAHILADGFSRTRKGDRFFFESSQSGLNKQQISAIKQYTYSQLLCEGNSMDMILSKAFYTVGKKGSIEVKCSSLNKLKLQLWKETSNNCYWQVISTTPCCRGRRTVIRRCIGAHKKCRCKGRSYYRERCSCSGDNDCHFHLHNCAGGWLGGSNRRGDIDASGSDNRFQPPGPVNNFAKPPRRRFSNDNTNDARF